MMRRLRAFVMVGAALLGVCVLALGEARAKTIEDLYREADGDTLALVIHGVQGHEATVREFQRRFPRLNVEVTVQNPSTMGPRIVTEQMNNVYAWDSWWAGTAAMNNVVLPAGGFEPITDYLVLDDVRNPNTWRTPNHLYTSPEPYIFLQSVNVESTILFNRDVVRGLEINSAEDLLDPRLRGLIALRDPSTATHNGAYTMAALTREEGVDFVSRLLIEQQPTIIENGRQVTDGALRGDYAVVLGGSGDILARCHNYGGCGSVTQLPFALSVASRGVAVMKNAPHPAATRLWVNWLLSREGQEVYVREWAKDQSTGATSMRRDVEPDPRHVGSVPDYDRLTEYGLFGMEDGKADLDAGLALFANVRGEIQHPPSVSARVVAVIAAALLLFWALHFLMGKLRRPAAASLARQ